MEQLLTYLLVAGLSFWIGMKLASVWQTIILKELLKDLGITDQQLRELAKKHGANLADSDEDSDELVLTEMEIRIEQHAGQLYAYRVEDDFFIGQGTDRESLIKRIAEDVADVKLIIRDENGASLLKEAH
jgi:hypothetical protein